MDLETGEPEEWDESFSAEEPPLEDDWLGYDPLDFEDPELYDDGDVPDAEPHSADDPWWNGMRTDW